MIMVTPRLHSKPNKTITLTKKEIASLLQEKELLKDKALIILSDTNYVEPSTFFTIRVSLTEQSLNILIEKDIIMDGITIKLEK